MDARKQQTLKNELPQRTKVWKPQSRIAGYIKGNVKLEEMVSREKLVRPEHRHNKRAFLALVNDDDEPTSATGYKSKSRSADTHHSVISRCPSTSTQNSTSLSRAGSAHPHQQLTTDDHTRTIVEKNEYITELREQLDALRSCARVENLPKGGAEPADDADGHRSLCTVLERMLECLLDMLTNLRHHDEHDERMAQFVAAVKRERENVLRSVVALCRANARKDDELRQMSGEQAAMLQNLQRLQADLERTETTSSLAKNHNNDLLQRIRTYEEKYQKAAHDLRDLSRLTESVRMHIVTEKEAFDKQTDAYRKQMEDHNKCIENLRSSCQNLAEKKKEAEKRVAQIEKRLADEMAQLRKENEECKESFKTDIRKLEDEIQRMTSTEQKLKEENTALVAQLHETQLANKQMCDEIKRLKEEKELIESTLEDEGTNNTDDMLRRTVENGKMASFAKQESQWHELKQRFYKTVLRAGIVQNDDVR